MKRIAGLVAALVLHPSTPEQLAAHTKQRAGGYRRILRAAGVQPE